MNILTTVSVGLVVVVTVYYESQSLDLANIGVDLMNRISFSGASSMGSVVEDPGFMENKAQSALSNLSQDDIEQTLIDAKKSIWDSVTGSKVVYRPTAALSSGNFQYSISFWCKIVDPPTEIASNKGGFVYLFRNGPPNQDSPGIEYSSETNQLRVGAMVSNGTVEKYNIDHIPTHKWNHIVIVSDHRNLDTYLNGELSRSYRLNGVMASMPRDQISLFPEYSSGTYSNTQITLLRIFPIALSGPQIKELHEKNYQDQVPHKKSWWMTPFWNPVKN